MTTTPQEDTVTAVTLDETAPLAEQPAVAPVRPGRRRRSPLQLLLHAVLALAAVLSVLGAGVVVVQRLGFSPVLTSSMVPTYDPGALLVTRPMDAGRIAVGQVLVLPLPDSPGQRYVHRVTEVRADAEGRPVVRTKGDNNPAADAWQLTITSAQVPQVVASAPTVGSLALLTNGSALRVPLMLLIAGCLLVAVKRALLDQR